MGERPWTNGSLTLRRTGRTGTCHPVRERQRRAPVTCNDRPPRMRTIRAVIAYAVGLLGSTIGPIVVYRSRYISSPWSLAALLPRLWPVPEFRDRLACRPHRLVSTCCDRLLYCRRAVDSVRIKYVGRCAHCVADPRRVRGACRGWRKSGY